MHYRRQLPCTDGKGCGTAVHGVFGIHGDVIGDTRLAEYVGNANAVIGLTIGDLGIDSPLRCDRTKIYVAVL